MVKANVDPECAASDIWFIGSFITTGDGFHGAHHDFPKHSHHGRYAWYNIDLVYYIICIFEKIGLVWNVTRGESPNISSKLRNNAKRNNDLASNQSVKNKKED